MISTGKCIAGAVALAALMTAGLSANAQNPIAHKGAKGERRMAKMAKELGLTDAQKTQIEPILKDAKEQKKAIDADKTLTPDKKKAKLQELGKATKEKVAAILTPEQKEKMKAAREAHKAKTAPKK